MLNKQEIEIIKTLPIKLDAKRVNPERKLINYWIITPNKPEELPRNISEARFWTECLANDFIIP